MDCGAYGGEQIFLTTMTAHTLGGNYRLGAVRLAAARSTPIPRPMAPFEPATASTTPSRSSATRTRSAPRSAWIALEFRRRNVLGNDDLGATGQVFEGDVLEPMLDRMERIAQHEPFEQTRSPATVSTDAARLSALGSSSSDHRRRRFNLNADGSATLVTAGVEIGSGSMVQSLPQIVADALGLRPEDVVVRAADTDAAGYDVGVGGGRTTVSLGAASLAACGEVREKLLGVAAQMLERRS